MSSRKILSLTAIGALLSACGVTTGTDVRATPEFTTRVVATDLANPWEITVGPDGYLWTTEKVAGRVTRISPAGGERRTALTVDDVWVTRGGQDGLLGLALHPGLLRDEGHDWVYVVYSYDAAPAEAGVQERMKITRYTYHSDTGTLREPLDVITGLPAAADHNSGRLKFGPDQRLYLTIGDLGANQFTSYCRPVLSQRLPTDEELEAEDFTAYQGKILRIDLDGGVPPDNPVLAGVRSHVFSYGHRNAQGIDFAPDGTMYSSEQGPKTDDEVNRIVSGGDYGWPRVAGYRADDAYVYGNWSASTGTPCGQLRYDDYTLPASVPTQRESDFTDPAFVPPLRTFYSVQTGYDFRDPDSACAATRSWNLCWPTVAPSSLEVYSAADGVPGWGESLLMPTLKNGTVYRMPVGADGTLQAEPEPLFTTVNRYRDTAVSPDGRTVYVATDPNGSTIGPGGVATDLANPGAILAFEYAG